MSPLRDMVETDESSEDIQTELKPVSRSNNKEKQGNQTYESADSEEKLVDLEGNFRENALSDDSEEQEEPNLWKTFAIFWDVANNKHL